MFKYKCIDCKQELDKASFYFRKTGIPYTRCKFCYLLDKRERNESRKHSVVSEKRCRRCALVKSSDYFHKNNSCRGGLSTICKDCQHIDNVETKYGIKNLDLLIRMRDGKCDICKKDFGTKPHVDHDHKCCASDYTCGSCFRGLLCADCNLGLGKFRDNPVSLRAAAVYLEEIT